MDKHPARIDCGPQPPTIHACKNRLPADIAWGARASDAAQDRNDPKMPAHWDLSLIHISEPTRLALI
eukprot:14981392-Alexandrium_andersonii.AAC.1